MTNTNWVPEGIDKRNRMFVEVRATLEMLGTPLLDSPLQQVCDDFNYAWKAYNLAISDASAHRNPPKIERDNVERLAKMFDEVALQTAIFASREFLKRSQDAQKGMHQALRAQNVCVGTSVLTWNI
jgi:hypothetical protein